MKTEIFAFVNSNADVINNDISDWLKKHPDIKIKFITQSESVIEASWSFTLSIFYIEDVLKGGQED